MAKIAFIGLGNMGLPMAANLVKAGQNVNGFDLSTANLKAASNEGITPAPTLETAVLGVEIIITMLPAGEHVLSVFQAISPHLKPDTLLIDCSTIDVENASAAHQIATLANCHSIDAPVSGGTGGAIAGTLTFMAGGSSAAFQLAEPVLANMGKRIVHCGQAGSGQAAKICNNMLLGISMIGVCEAFALGERLGLSHQALFDVASTSSGQCWSLNTYCPVPGPVPSSPANSDYQPGFSAGLMLKDLSLAANAAHDAGLPSPLGNLAKSLYAEFAEAGNGATDFSGIIKMLRAAKINQ